MAVAYARGVLAVQCDFADPSFPASVVELPEPKAAAPAGGHGGGMDGMY